MPLENSENEAKGAMSFLQLETMCPFNSISYLIQRELPPLKEEQTTPEVFCTYLNQSDCC